MSQIPDHHSAESQEPDFIEAEVVEPSPSTALAKIETDLATLQAHTQAQMQASQVMVEFQTNMRKMVYNNRRENHWIRFGDKIRPDGSECLRIRMLLGVDININPVQRDDYEDDGGKYYVYHTTGEAAFGPITVPCFGCASSRTKFFARSHGEYVDPRDINPSFIAKMAWMDAFKSGIRILFGLDIDPDELGDIKGKSMSDRASKFKPTPKDHSKSDTPELAEQRAYIRSSIIELSGGDNNKARFFLDALTTFTTSDGKLVKGKTQPAKLTAKQVANLYRWRDKSLTPEKYEAVMAAQGGQQ